MTRSKLTKGLVAGAAALATAASLAAVPTAASAQSAPYGSGYGQPGGHYDPCRRDTTNRSTVGGLSGAAIGAAIGSGIAAKGVRTEGAVLGGLLGAVVGAKVGHDSAACAPGAYPQQQPAPYGQPAASMPYGTPYSGAPYDARPYSGGYGQQGEYHYGYSTPYEQGGYGQAYGYPVAERTSSDDCQLAESPIYLPDGQVQKRFVRVCRDGSGRYQVVD